MVYILEGRTHPFREAFSLQIAPSHPKSVFQGFGSHFRKKWIFLQSKCRNEQFRMLERPYHVRRDSNTFQTKYFDAWYAYLKVAPIHFVKLFASKLLLPTQRAFFKDLGAIFEKSGFSCKVNVEMNTFACSNDPATFGGTQTRSKQSILVCHMHT